MTIIEQPRPLDENTNDLQERRKLIGMRSTVDDLVVLLGLTISGRLSADLLSLNWLSDDFKTLRKSEIADGIASIFADKRMPVDQWNELHQVWYRWKVPFGTASLYWWFLFCSALKTRGTMPEACDLWGEWLDSISNADVVKRVDSICELIGIPRSKGVVAVRDESSAVLGLILAAMKGVPVIPVISEQEVAILENTGIAVVWTDTTSVNAARTSAGDGVITPRPGEHLRDDALVIWLAMNDDERTFVLVHLEQRLASLEIVRLSYGNDVMENDGIAAVLSNCRTKAPSEWSAKELSTATVCWSWQQAGFIIQELNQSELSLAALRRFLNKRMDDYVRLSEAPIIPELSLAALVDRFAKRRRVVEGRYQRCLYFDGGNWERREFWISKAQMMNSTQEALPSSRRDYLAERFDTRPSSGASIYELKAYLNVLVSKGRTPSELLMAVADWSANTDDLPTDYAIFTVPQGIKLDRPWDILIDEIFCYTAFRNGFQPNEAGVPLKRVGIANAIGQRMRFNAVKKAQNYALVKHMTPQSFLLPDISVAEDAHQGGHTAAGVRHTCRIPIGVTHRGSLWKGIADIRLSRADYRDSARFREDELPTAMRYGYWAKAIADEAYVLGCLFDKAYCVNLDDGRDVDSRLRKAS